MSGPNHPPIGTTFQTFLRNSVPQKYGSQSISNLSRQPFSNQNIQSRTEQSLPASFHFSKPALSNERDVDDRQRLSDQRMAEQRFVEATIADMSRSSLQTGNTGRYMPENATSQQDYYEDSNADNYEDYYRSDDSQGHHSNMFEPNRRQDFGTTNQGDWRPITRNDSVPVKKAGQEELSEAEIKFDEQFGKWDDQFKNWKKQNINSADQRLYKEEEKKWESWRNTLLERREQMRRKRLELASRSINNSSQPSGNSSQYQGSLEHLSRPFAKNATSVAPVSESPFGSQLSSQNFLQKPDYIGRTAVISKDTDFLRGTQTTTVNFNENQYGSQPANPNISQRFEDFQRSTTVSRDPVFFKDNDTLTRNFSDSRYISQPSNQNVSQRYDDLQRMSTVSRDVNIGKETEASVRNILKFFFEQPSSSQNFPQRTGDADFHKESSSTLISENSYGTQLSSQNISQRYDDFRRASLSESQYGLQPSNQSVSQRYDDFQSKDALGTSQVPHISQSMAQKIFDSFSKTTESKNDTQVPSQIQQKSMLSADHVPSSSFGTNSEGALSQKDKTPSLKFELAEEISEEEILLRRKFAVWDEQFSKWKRQHISNPNKEQYLIYENQWREKGHILAVQIQALQKQRMEEAESLQALQKQRMEEAESLKKAREEVANFGPPRFEPPDESSDTIHSQDLSSEEKIKNDLLSWERFFSKWQLQNSRFSNTEQYKIQEGVWYSKRQTLLRQLEAIQLQRETERFTEKPVKDDHPEIQPVEEPPEELSDEEKELQRKLATWEYEFSKWEDENIGSLSRNYFAMYEREWRMVRDNIVSQMQMLRKRRLRQKVIFYANEDDPILEPQKVIDYHHEHKNWVDLGVAVEPLRTFDYRHRRLNRIPVPERPHWLNNVVCRIREFNSFVPFHSTMDMSLRDRMERENVWTNEREDTWNVKELYERRSEDSYKDDMHDKHRGVKSDVTLTYHEDTILIDDDDSGGGRSPDKGVTELTDIDSTKKETKALQKKIVIGDESFYNLDSDTKASADSRKKYFLEFADDEDVEFSDAERADSRMSLDSSNKGEVIVLSDDDHVKSAKPKADNSSSLVGLNVANQGVVVENTPRKLHGVTMIHELLNKPGRYNRPARIAIVFRGLPGSGKSYLSRLIRDLEVGNGGNIPIILSIDDYFLVEQRREVIVGGMPCTTVNMVYNFIPEMEEAHQLSLINAFKSRVESGYSFIIVDNINASMKHISEMLCIAMAYDFQIFVCHLDIDLEICLKRNVHGRTRRELEWYLAQWEPTPRHCSLLDVSILVPELQKVQRQVVSYPTIERINQSRSEQMNFIHKIVWNKEDEKSERSSGAEMDRDLNKRDERSRDLVRTQFSRWVNDRDKDDMSVTRRRGSSRDRDKIKKPQKEYRRERERSRSRGRVKESSRDRDRDIESRRRRSRDRDNKERNRKTDTSKSEKRSREDSKYDSNKKRTSHSEVAKENKSKSRKEQEASKRCGDAKVVDTGVRKDTLKPVTVGQIFPKTSVRTAKLLGKDLNRPANITSTNTQTKDKLSGLSSKNQRVKELLLLNEKNKETSNKKIHINLKTTSSKVVDAVKSKTSVQESQSPKTPDIVNKNVTPIASSAPVEITLGENKTSSNNNLIPSKAEPVKVATKTDKLDKKKAPVQNITNVEDLIYPPSRYTRPRQLVIIMRGLPGSGKSVLARLIKLKENQYGGPDVRFTSFDSYYLRIKENKKGKKSAQSFDPNAVEKEKMAVFQIWLKKIYEVLLAARTCPFIVVDSVNEKLKYVSDIFASAKNYGYEAYVCQLDVDPIICFHRNIHQITEEEVNKYFENWELLPPHYPTLNANSFLQREQIPQISIADIRDPKKETMVLDVIKKLSGGILPKKWRMLALDSDGIEKPVILELVNDKYRLSTIVLKPDSQERKAPVAPTVPQQTKPTVAAVNKNKPTQVTTVKTKQVIDVEPDLPDPEEKCKHNQVVGINELLQMPGRLERPPLIVIILRGLPGSGKSTLAHLIKETEIEHEAPEPHILCMDDHFMVERQKEIFESGKPAVKFKEKVYQYNPAVERRVRPIILKTFVKLIVEDAIPFIIVDSINEQIKYFADMYDIAEANGYKPYICSMGPRTINKCANSNVHGRTKMEIQNYLKNWEVTPPEYTVLKALPFPKEETRISIPIETIKDPEYASYIKEFITNKTGGDICATYILWAKYPDGTDKEVTVRWTNERYILDESAKPVRSDQNKYSNIIDNDVIVINDDDDEEDVNNKLENSNENAIDPPVVKMISGILNLPGRFNRPPFILIILRVPPGNRKTDLSMIITAEEKKSGVTPVKVISCDEFMIYQSKKLREGLTEQARSAARESLGKQFELTVSERKFPLVIVEDTNEKVCNFAHLAEFATQKGYKVYVCEVELGKDHWIRQNESVPPKYYPEWEPTPPQYNRLDATSLLDKVSPELTVDDLACVETRQLILATVKRFCNNILPKDCVLKVRAFNGMQMKKKLLFANGLFTVLSAENKMLAKVSSCVIQRTVITDLGIANTRQKKRDDPFKRGNKIKSLIHLVSPFMKNIRPSNIVMLLRGPPGSGKSHLANCVKNDEIKNGNPAPYVLSANDITFKQPAASIYQSDDRKHNQMLASFKTLVIEKKHSFIIIDAINRIQKNIKDFFILASSKNYEFYVAEMEMDLQMCLERNIHEYSDVEIRKYFTTWQNTPPGYNTLFTLTYVHRLTIDDLTNPQMQNKVFETIKRLCEGATPTVVRMLIQQDNYMKYHNLQLVDGDKYILSDMPDSNESDEPELKKAKMNNRSEPGALKIDELFTPAGAEKILSTIKKMSGSIPPVYCLPLIHTDGNLKWTTLKFVSGKYVLSDATQHVQKATEKISVLDQKKTKKNISNPKAKGTPPKLPTITLEEVFSEQARDKITDVVKKLCEGKTPLVTRIPVTHLAGSSRWVTLVLYNGRYVLPEFAKEKETPQVKPTGPTSEIQTVEDLINPPKRTLRPPRIVVILRGPSGSGKTFLARQMKEIEIRNGGSPPKIMSLEQHAMVKTEKKVLQNGKQVTFTEMSLKYDAEKEEIYRKLLMNSFKKTIMDGYFFVIVDCVNQKVKEFADMSTFAKANKFEVFVCQMDLNAEVCAIRNMDGKSLSEIEQCIKGWEPTPPEYLTLNPRPFLWKIGLSGKIPASTVSPAKRKIVPSIQQKIVMPAPPGVDMAQEEANLAFGKSERKMPVDRSTERNQPHVQRKRMVTPPLAPPGVDIEQEEENFAYGRNERKRPLDGGLQFESPKSLRFEPPGTLCFEPPPENELRFEPGPSAENRPFFERGRWEPPDPNRSPESHRETFFERTRWEAPDPYRSPESHRGNIFRRESINYDDRLDCRTSSNYDIDNSRRSLSVRSGETSRQNYRFSPDRSSGYDANREDWPDDRRSMERLDAINERHYFDMHEFDREEEIRERYNNINKRLMSEYGKERYSSPDRSLDGRYDWRSGISDLECASTGTYGRQRESIVCEDEFNDAAEDMSLDSACSYVERNEEYAVTHNEGGIHMIEDIVNPRGKHFGLPRVVIVMRGPPGSGKSHLAKMLWDRENENEGAAPCILSLDEYFMTKRIKEVFEDGVVTLKEEIFYQHEPEMEASYRATLIEDFKDTIRSACDTFIIVDSVNEKIEYFAEICEYAKESGFQVYICEMELNPTLCFQRNIHHRSAMEIEECVAKWEVTPPYYSIVDVSSWLFQ